MRYCFDPKLFPDRVIVIDVDARPPVEKMNCPECGGVRLRAKDRRLRRLRHESWEVRHTVLELES